ncbi:MAG: ABC transporter permease [Opitutae bacterium]|nr:ABC transporter permease [Opitutae bacterium]
MTKQFAIGTFAIMLAFFACFFIWPIVQILQGGFFDQDGNFTLAFFIEVFQNPIYLEGLLNAFLLAILSTALALLLALPLAFVFDRFAFPGKKLLGGLIILPIMLPPFVGAIGLRQLLGQFGMVNSFLIDLGWMNANHPIDWLSGDGRFYGVAILNALSLYPILYLNAQASLANIDPAMEEAAENLGCRGWKKFFTITLPLMRPGLFAGGTIVFIWAFTELGTPLMFDYTRVTPVQIFNGIKDIGGNPFPYALVGVMLITSIILYSLGKGLFGRQNFAMMAKASHVAQPKELSAVGRWACTGFFMATIVIAMLPHLTVIGISFSSDWYQTILPAHWTLEHYEVALGHQLTVPAIQNSLLYSSVAVVANVTLGIAIAYVIVRTKLPGRGALDAMAMLPLAVPGLVMAFGYLSMSQEGKFFGFLNPTENPTVLLIIAYAVRKLPFVVRSAVAGLQQTSVTYEEAAQNLGCPPLRSALQITIPLIMANLLAGALLAFSQCMLEVSDSLILAQKMQYYPITKAIYELMGFLGSGRYLASALGVWAMIFLGVTIVGASLLLGKKLGAIFRL